MVFIKKLENNIVKNLDLSIIILNYNTQDWLQNCLEKIDAFPPQNIKGEVIVVDNASSDGSVEMVKNKFPAVRLIQSAENGGFSKGNNLGIRKALGRYIMLLNSDTEFTPDTHLEKIVWLMDQNPEIGVTTPRLQLPDGSLDLASHRGEPTPWAAFTYFSKLEKYFPNIPLFGQYHQTWKNFDEIHEIEACSGGAMIVRASALKKVGLLDETFFMYAEDLDWCRRFREAGYKIYYYPDSVVIHHKYKSGRGKNKRTDITHAPIDTNKYLRIPGFMPTSSNIRPTPNPAEHHFWETMKQYYSKHYGKSNPFQTKLIHMSVDMMRFFKKKR